MAGLSYELNGQNFSSLLTLLLRGRNRGKVLSSVAATSSYILAILANLGIFMELNEIREQSIQTAKRLGVDILPTLPLLDSGLEMRSTEQTLSRLLVLNAVAATAYGLDKAKAIAWLNQEALTDSLSEKEKRFIFDGIGQSDRFKMQVESMWALTWAMGITNELNFAKDCDNRFVTMLPNLKENQSSAHFRRQAKPRRFWSKS